MKRTIRVFLGCTLLSVSLLGCGLKQVTMGSGDKTIMTPSDETQDSITEICEVTREDSEYEIGDVTLAVATENEFEKSFELKFGEESTSFIITCFEYKLYQVVFEGREYLYIGSSNDFGGYGLTVVPIYDISAAKPYYMENAYGLYTEDKNAISGIDDIRLTRVSQVFGSTLLIRHFHIEEGIPVPNDKFAYYVTDMDSQQQDSSKACGDTITAVKDMEADMADSIDSGDFSKKTIPAGTKLTYYKISDNKEIFFVTDDGQVVRFTSTDNSVLDGVYTTSDFEDVPVFG